jgi:WD40 repeat protein
MTDKNIRITASQTLTGHNAAIYTLQQPPLTLPKEGNTGIGHINSTIIKNVAEKIWSAGSDGMIAEWQPLDNENAILRASVAETVLSLACSGDILIVGTMNGGVHFIDLTTKTEIKSVFAHPKGVFDLKIHKNELFSIGADGKLTRWNLQTLLPIETLGISHKTNSASLNTLRSFDFYKNICAIASSDSTIYLVNTLYNETKVEKIIPNAHIPSVFVVRFSPCGKYLVSGGRDAFLRVWEIAEDFALYHAIPAHLATINDIQYSPDGELFATASRDKTIKIWSAHDFQLLKVIDSFKNGGHFNSVNKLLWLNDSTLCSASDDRTVRVFTIL